jgi:hypothetical protein
LQVVPEIGGRVIQYSLGDYGFFWVNKDLVDKKPPESGLAPDGGWLNYGGDKLWPAPQGWSGEHEWPGPPDAILDGQPYAAEVIKEKDKVSAVKLTSREDKRSGIQFSRTIKIFEDTTRISVDAMMKNIDDKNRRWGIWSHTQFNAGDRGGPGYNKNYRAYCPINPKSIFPKGYDVIFGLAQNPQFRPDYEKNLMRVHYEGRVGKIGLDSDAGWIATVDATDGYCFVQRFKFEPGKKYPDNSSVEFWTNGVGEIYAYNKIIKMPEEFIYNFESEMIAPFADLEPGQSSNFHYDWFAARIEPNLPVVACSDVGVVCEPLSAELSGDTIFGLNLEGSFGVFYKGYMQMVFLDENNKEILEGPKPKFPITPLEPVRPLKIAGVAGQIHIPKDAVKVALNVYDAKGRFAGKLAEAKILKN